MNTPQLQTKLCKYCKQPIPPDATVCPYCRKKQKGGAGKWILGILGAFILLGLIGSLGKGGSEKKNDSEFEVTAKESVSEDIKESVAEEAKEPEQSTEAESDKSSEESEESSKEVAEASSDTVMHVGDEIMDGDLKILYMASGDYTEESEFMQPADGNKYIFLQLYFENTGKSDESVSSFNFDCYADGYNAEMYYGGDDDLGATLSSGRSTSGYIYFEVPENAEKIEIEYSPNAFFSKRILLEYEGNVDSGFVHEANSEATEDALHIGDVAESNTLKVSYLSCEEYVSDNEFIQPKDGYYFLSCNLEFENVGSSDVIVSSFSFDCYADGKSCEQSFVREDSLDATLSPGRKTVGSVTFEVPIDASTVEVEYLTNYWTSNRLVFAVEF